MRKVKFVKRTIIKNKSSNKDLLMILNHDNINKNKLF